MSVERFRREHRRTTSQQGLGGAPVRDALGELLADASAPARPSELVGEEAAVAAFRDARLADGGKVPRRSTHMLKVAAAAVAVVAVGGVAFVATAGSSPNPGGSVPVLNTTSERPATTETSPAGATTEPSRSVPEVKSTGKPADKPEDGDTMNPADPPGQSAQSGRPDPPNPPNPQDPPDKKTPRSAKDDRHETEVSKRPNHDDR